MKRLLISLVALAALAAPSAALANGVVLKAGERAVQIENGKGPADIPYDQIVRANLIDEGTTG